MDALEDLLIELGGGVFPNFEKEKKNFISVIYKRIKRSMAME